MIIIKRARQKSVDISQRDQGRFFLKNQLKGQLLRGGHFEGSFEKGGLGQKLIDDRMQKQSFKINLTDFHEGK